MAKAGLINLDYLGMNRAYPTQMQVIVICKPPPIYLPHTSMATLLETSLSCAASVTIMTTNKLEQVLP